MFGISFFELLIILFVMVIFTRSSDIPHLITAYKKFVFKFVNIKRELLENLRYIHNDIVSPINDDPILQDNYHYILDDEGRIHKAYDTIDVKNSKSNKENS